MIIDALSLPDGYATRTTVCIIGCGVAGITLARELSGGGFDVAVLESGGFEGDKGTQALSAGENVGQPYFPLETARSRQFGGSSPRWTLELGNGRLGGRLRPMSPIDFEKRDWVPHSGWPFGFDELRPYYERAQTVCKVGPFDYSADAWEQPSRTPRLPLDPERVDTAVYQAIDREVFRGYRDELENAPNVSVYLHATALEVETDRDGQYATEVRAARLDGKRLKFAADIVVIGVGGIEAPRLMLLSNSTHRNGLGNQNDLVGRFFMEHPHLWSGYLRPADKAMFDRTGLYGVHTVRGTPVIGQLTLPDAVQREQQLLNYAVVLKPGFVSKGRKQAISRGFGAVRAAAGALSHGDVEGFGRHMSTLFPVAGELTVGAYRKGMRVVNRMMRVKPFEVFRLNHMTEQAPNPDSRVLLADARDAFGQRRVRLDWRLTSLDVRSIVRAQEILDAELRRTGLGHLQIELNGDSIPADIHGGWHHMGTTRMHVDARQGVVDPQCRVHGVDNLYVAGASVFPTSGCANPVLTTVALTLRLADHLKRRLAEGAVTGVSRNTADAG